MNSTQSLNIAILEAPGELIKGYGYGTILRRRIIEIGHNVNIYEKSSWNSLKPESYDLILLTGGEIPVSSSGEWMVNSLNILRELVKNTLERSGPPLVGFCLGSQMLAHVLYADNWQGNVVKSAPRFEIGFNTINFGNSRHSVAEFHYEAIDAGAVVAGGGEIEASSQYCETETFSHGGGLIFGMQFHPELSPKDMLEVLNYNYSMLGEFGRGATQVLATIEDASGAWSLATLEYAIGRAMGV